LSICDRAKAIGIFYLLWDKVPVYLIQEVVWNYGAPVATASSFHPAIKSFSGM
jgi:adenine-specific DNA-methyltransferase